MFVYVDYNIKISISFDVQSRNGYLYLLTTNNLMEIHKNNCDSKLSKLKIIIEFVLIELHSIFICLLNYIELHSFNYCRR